MAIKKLKKEQLLMGALFGILLLVVSIPVPKKEKKMKENTENKEVKISEEHSEERLKEVLQKISGVGKVEIYITYKDQGKLVVEKDETVSEEFVEEADSSGGTRNTTTVQKERRTVFEGEEVPYIVQELAPSVEGVLVVAEGGGNEAIKMQIKNTIEALFGIDSHKISIMKMEVTK